MIDFAEAVKAVQDCLDDTYADELESPKALPQGFDTGDAWAPLIDWDGVLGVYIFLVDKATGDLTPQSFSEFEDQSVTVVANLSGFHHVLAATRARIANHPGHSSQKSHGRRGGGERVADLEKGPARNATAAAQGTNPEYGTTFDGGVYRDAGRAGQKWTPDMGDLPSGAFEENCTNAVMAFEMRSRGYNVKAAPLDVLDKYGYAGGRTQAEVDDLVSRGWQGANGKPHGRSFAGQKWRPLKEVDKEVESWPEGGRGFMSVGKHVFSVVKRRGKATYVESQFDEVTANRIVTTQYRKKYGGKYGEAKVIRLDDLEPTDDIFDAIEVE